MTKAKKAKIHEQNTPVYDGMKNQPFENSEMEHGSKSEERAKIKQIKAIGGLKTS